jgi:periplasmic divalent cation tolerance protein
MESRFIYITAKDKEEARRIGEALVGERLAACVNILDPVESLYWWEDKIQHDHETVLIAKTSDRLVDDVVRCVKKVHSYECPCIVALPIREGNPGFLEWIAREVGEG